MRKLLLWCWLALIWMPVGCTLEDDPDDYGPPDDDFAADDDTGDPKEADGDDSGDAS